MFLDTELSYDKDTKTKYFINFIIVINLCKYVTKFHDSILIEKTNKIFHCILKYQSLISVADPLTLFKFLYKNLV
jgi:hypothetical protein